VKSYLKGSYDYCCTDDDHYGFYFQPSPYSETERFGSDAKGWKEA